MQSIVKRTNGQYFTACNPFQNPGFLDWAAQCAIKTTVIVEPFAGSNNLIKMLQSMGLCDRFVAYDILPQCNTIQVRDTIQDFPTGFRTCITNPPYLAQNSAKRRGLAYPQTQFDDLYKVALDKCLHNCDAVAAIVPASFLNSELFRDRLSHYILLNSKLFTDTDHPVCLALFTKHADTTHVYEGSTYLGVLHEIEKKAPQKKHPIAMKFNDKTGNLGLFAIDNTVAPSIRFCKGSAINATRVSQSSRSITRISIDCDIDKLLATINDRLAVFRKETFDLLLTPFKGLRRDNKFRRRLDYAMARLLIAECI